jgi:N-acetylneuraminate synthase
VASADLTNIPFLRKIASKGKPIVLSTGASSLIEVDIALQEIARVGCLEVALLHCILNYPTENRNANLRMIKGLQRAYPNHVVGYSDHTLPDESMSSLVAAYLLGAVVLEKHFTHDKTMPGNDHYHAMDQHDLSKFVRLSKNIHQLLGKSDHKEPIFSEKISRKNARRSIVIGRAVIAGQVICEQDLTYKRPGTGISPLHWDEVVGLRAARALPEDHILQWQDLIPME